MLDELKNLLGSEWEVKEVDQTSGHKQFVCTHSKGTYNSPWFKVVNLGHVVYMARMCNQLISEPQMVDYQE